MKTLIFAMAVEAALAALTGAPSVALAQQLPASLPNCIPGSSVTCGQFEQESQAEQLEQVEHARSLEQAPPSAATPSLPSLTQIEDTQALQAQAQAEQQQAQETLFDEMPPAQPRLQYDGPAPTAQDWQGLAYAQEAEQVLAKTEAAVTDELQTYRRSESLANRLLRTLASGVATFNQGCPSEVVPAGSPAPAGAVLFVGNERLLVHGSQARVTACLKFARSLAALYANTETAIKSESSIRRSLRAGMSSLEKDVRMEHETVEDVR